MDVPYDPACPLLIDSDEESIEDEILGKRANKDLEIEFEAKASTQNRFEHDVDRSQIDGKFVPAFEDDNEELLEYCLRESGFLSDDIDAVSKQSEMKAQDGSGLDEEEKGEAKTHRKKKKKDKNKDEERSKKEKRKKEPSSEEREKKKTDHGRSKPKEARKSSHGENGKKEKSFEIIKEKKEKRKSTSSESEINFDDTDDDDDVEMLAVRELEEEEDAFPLSKTEGIAVDGGKIKSKESVVNDEKQRHKSNKEKHGREKKKEAEPKKADKDKKKRKRKRSKSSHKRSEDSEPDQKKKKKNKHRETSKERHDKGKRQDKGKVAHTKSEKKHKDHMEDEKRKEKERRQKKKRKEHDKKDHEDRLSSKSKDNKHRSSHSDHSQPRKYELYHSDKSKDKEIEAKHRHRAEVEKQEIKNYSDKSKDKEIEAKSRRKAEHERHAIKNYSDKPKDKEIEAKPRRKAEAERHEMKRNERRNSKESENKDGKKSHSRHKEKERSAREAVAKDQKDKPKMIDDKEKVVEKKAKENASSGEHKIKESRVEDAKSNMPDTDTDSEFERLSDIEKEIEKDKGITEMSEPECEVPSIKVSTENGKADADISTGRNMLIAGDESVENNDLHESIAEAPDNHDDDTPVEDEESKDSDMIIDKIIENKELSSNDMPKINDDVSLDTNQDQSENSSDKTTSSQKNGEKRPFKIFSREETKKLHNELLSQDGVEEEETDYNIDNQVVKAESKGADIAANGVELEEEKTESQIDGPEVKVEDLEVEQKEKSQMQKSKDDLFDDIFSKEEDSVSKENDGLARMLGKAEETSPNKSSFKKQMSTSESDKTFIKDEKKGEGPTRKTPNLKLEDGKFNGRKGKSPNAKKTKIPKETIIPGLEPVSIPGLEITTSVKEEGFQNKAEPAISPKIPLLFDDEAPFQKPSIPKTPEFSPSKEKATKKKQPYTPPEEFTGQGEGENNQFDRYYHLEADESPYNPEDLTLVDIGLSPVDANTLQQDALKGAVEMRLKEPFSGYENPTWQKIIEAKSRHEVKRQMRKGSQEKQGNEGAKEFSKPNSSKQQKMVNMLVRQSRVEQECKEVLKLYYKSKEITKDEYKNILRKAVPQVTMSNSPIIPEKIRSLMKKFVCKCKGQRLMSGSEKTERKKSKRHAAPSFSQSLTFPGEKRFRYLNPNLPMPPL